MRQLLTRTFDVEPQPPQVWDALVDAEAWPQWARHIARVDLTPPGPVSDSTHAVIVLTNRTKARVAVTEFEPGRRFRWDGSFLWLDLAYDHLVEATSNGGSTVTFTVHGNGSGISSLGRLFARIYARNLDRAIPRFQTQLNEAEPTELAP